MTKTTAEKIKRLRESLNYSQEYFARELGISQPAFAKMESGMTRITLKRLVKIAELLEVEPQELLEGNWTINQYNNGHAYGIVENLHQENKEMLQKLIAQLESENSRLREANQKLWGLNENLRSRSGG